MLSKALHDAISSTSLKGYLQQQHILHSCHICTSVLVSLILNMFMQLSFFFVSFLFVFSRHYTASTGGGGARSGLQLYQCWRLPDPGREWTSAGEWDL